MAINEDVFYEGGPHIGDLILNCLLAPTLVCLPLTFGAIVRALWLRYRVTSRRISVDGGWRGEERSDFVYSEITKVVNVARGFGLWGDIVVTLKDGSKIEMRSVPRFRELTDYINERVAEKTMVSKKASSSKNLPPKAA